MPSSIKLTKKITGMKIVTPEETQPEREVLHERMERPEKLSGTTYKIKPPTSEHAMYITINDVVLNEGTPHETRHPYEMLIHSKNTEQFQWVSALARLISAVFRKGGDISFLVDELKHVFDPKGGYFKKRQMIPSEVAEIGMMIEQHLAGLKPDSH